MITVESIAAQGELLLSRVDEVPEGADRLESQDGRWLVLGHSETGHHHAIDVQQFPEVQLFELSDDQLNAYLKVGQPFADLVHLRGYDAHETLRLPKGTYQIRRQREHWIDGWRQVQD
jgi:ribosome modulation factor